MCAAPLPTGTVTFLFTDIEGSTRLLQRLGADYTLALGESQALLRAAFAAHNGAEVDTQGDAFFVAFPSAPQAVAAAVAATRALTEHPWPAGATVRVRMGLHTGAPQLVGDHYVGLDVHRAARIAAAGHGGQILLSQTTRDLAAQALPAGATLRDMGAHRLKDLREPERLYQLVFPDLPADFPPLKTLGAHQHNLPLQPTPLLGREQQVAAVCALLRRDDVRLITLTGPGGIGKTRLGIQVAAEVVEDFADGVWFVRLSRLNDPTLVVPTIAQTLGLQEQSSQPIADTLRVYLANRRLLLLLDNFEQVVGAAADMAELLATSSGLSVLATSRLPLRLRGEHVAAVPPLPLAAPEHLSPPDRLTQYAAVALFLERARAAQDTFTVTAANAPAIAEICARLDGLPLAIELAAARARVLPPEALLGRLSAQLNVLTGGARDLEERQQTMRATIAWSEGLLAPEEGVLFRRLAVFVGGVTIEAAEMTCSSPIGCAPLGLDLLEGLSALVDQSLMQQRDEGGEPRFAMLHVIREYALERLEASGEAEALRRAHASYYLALAERAEQEFTGTEAGVWLDRLEREHDNLRAALGWARERGEVETGLRLVAALRGLWWGRGHLREGRAWAEALLAIWPKSASASLLARALLAAGTMALWQGDAAAAAPWLEEAAALARAADDLRTASRAVTDLGILASEQGDWERAAARYEEGLALARQLSDRWGEAVALTNIGDLALRQGFLERAMSATHAALALFRQVGDRGGAATALVNLAWVARKRGEVAHAEALAREALTLDRDLGDPRRSAEALSHLAAIAGVVGQGERAARLLGAAAAAREMLGAPLPPQEEADKEEAVASARASLGEETWAAAFAAGRALSLEEAIAEALRADAGHDDRRADLSG